MLVLGMTYWKEEGMSLFLSYWTTNRNFLNICNRTIGAFSIQLLACKNCPSVPSLSHYLFSPYRGFFTFSIFFLFFSFLGAGGGGYV